MSTEIAKINSFTKDTIKSVFTEMAIMEPRDLSISIIANGVPDKLKDLAIAHLDKCADCTKYISSDGKYAVIKVEPEKAVYDEEDPDIVKARTAVAKAKEALKAKEDKLKQILAKKVPTHKVQSHYYKRSNP